MNREQDLGAKATLELQSDRNGSIELKANPTERVRFQQKIAAQSGQYSAVEESGVPALSETQATKLIASRSLDLSSPTTHPSHLMSDHTGGREMELQHAIAQITEEVAQKTIIDGADPKALRNALKARGVFERYCDLLTDERLNDIARQYEQKHQAAWEKYYDSLPWYKRAAATAGGWLKKNIGQPFGNFCKDLLDGAKSASSQISATVLDACNTVKEAATTLRDAVSKAWEIREQIVRVGKDLLQKGLGKVCEKLIWVATHPTATIRKIGTFIGTTVVAGITQIVRNPLQVLKSCGSFIMGLAKDLGVISLYQGGKHCITGLLSVAVYTARTIGQGLFDLVTFSGDFSTNLKANLKGIGRSIIEARNGLIAGATGLVTGFCEYTGLTDAGRCVSHLWDATRALARGDALGCALSLAQAGSSALFAGGKALTTVFTLGIATGGVICVQQVAKKAMARLVEKGIQGLSTKLAEEVSAAVITKIGRETLIDTGRDLAKESGKLIDRLLEKAGVRTTTKAGFESVVHAVQNDTGEHVAGRFAMLLKEQGAVEIIQQQVRDRFLHRITTNSVGELSSALLALGVTAKKREASKIAKALKKAVHGGHYQSAIGEELENKITARLTHDVLENMLPVYRETLDNNLKRSAKRFHLDHAQESALRQASEQGFREGIERGVRKITREGIQRALREFYRPHAHVGRSAGSAGTPNFGSPATAKQVDTGTGEMRARDRRDTELTSNDKVGAKLDEMRVRLVERQGIMAIVRERFDPDTQLWLEVASTTVGSNKAA